MPHVFVPYRARIYPDGFVDGMKQAVRAAGIIELSDPPDVLKPGNFSFKFLVDDDPHDDLNRDFAIIIIHPCRAVARDPDGCADRIGRIVTAFVESFQHPEMPNEVTISVSLCYGPMGFSAASILTAKGMQRATASQ